MKNKDIACEIKYLEEKYAKANSELLSLKKMVPDNARLRAAKHGKGYQYFLVRRWNENNGSYIKNDDRKTAVILAQIEYDEKLIKVLNKSIADLKEFKEYFRENPFEAALNRMIPGKRELVKIPYTSDDDFIINWKNQEYDGLDFKEGFPEYYTRNGLRVRSKSEVIIADILDEMHVPFLYEKPLQLNTGIVHPDFTLLNISERKEVYWEHFGMMDDVEYRQNAFQKIKNYESNGLFQYDSVIWTFESGRNPINTRDIRRMVSVLQLRLGYQDE